MGDVMLTREAKARLFDEDFMWLEKQSRTLECGHLMDTVKWVAAEIRAGHDPFEYWQARCEQAERELAIWKPVSLEQVKEALAAVGAEPLTKEELAAKEAELAERAKWRADELEAEKNRRVYYQNIVYAVCNQLDSLNGKRPGEGVVCGTVDEPSTETQYVLKEAIERLKQAEQERDELKDEWDKLLYINSVLKILGDSGLTPEQSVVELGERLKDAERERDELRAIFQHYVDKLDLCYQWEPEKVKPEACEDFGITEEQYDRLIGKGE